MKSIHLTETEVRDLFSLTQKLLQFDTVNPPGNEKLCAHFIGDFLRALEFEVNYYEFEANRTSLIARLAGKGQGKPLTFSGHIDTVPLGKKQWQYLPFEGEIIDDKIYGRGSSDMKAALAAMLITAGKVAREKSRNSDFWLVITAGEECGCIGAEFLATLDGILPQGGAILIGEPTGNFPFLGHKGTLWLEIIFSGRNAHGSMPHLGDNAIYKATDAIQKLRQFQFTEQHPLLGKPTLNIGTMQGGLNINSVPDRACFTVDIRTVHGQSHEELHRRFEELSGPEAEIWVEVDAPAVASDPSNPWVQKTLQYFERRWQKKIAAATAPYFTDAGALVPAMGFPQTLIIGPGELEQAHVTDEFCYVAKLIEAAEIYTGIALDWLTADSVI